MYFNSTLEKKVKNWLKKQKKRLSVVVAPADAAALSKAADDGEETKTDPTHEDEVKEVLEVVRRYSASFEAGGIDLANLQAEEEDDEEKVNPFLEL